MHQSFFDIILIKFLAEYTKKTSGASITYDCGWGLIVVFILLGLWFVLSAVQFVLDIVASRKETTEKK